MWVISDTDKYIATTWGSTVSLTAGEAKEVGQDIGILCLQNGCTEVHDIQTKPVAEIVEEVSVEEVLETLDTVIETTTPDLDNMTKGQIEAYGRTIGIELDKRKKKADLIEEIQAAQ
tara:strand:- start:19 stop:369 length:351 start_codon:yes stop_codon:yes gene_type:complete